MSSSSGSSKEKVETVFVAVVEEESSGEDPPMSEWSSLVELTAEMNIKRLLFAKDLYNPGSGEICAKCVTHSDSDVLNHVYYNYPAVRDPGITEALLAPEKPIVYPDNGQDLYLALCKEMHIAPVGLFHRNLLNDEINLNYYCVSPLNVRAMAIALNYNKFVKKFSLVDSFLNADACYHLGVTLNSNVTLRELNLSGCRIGKAGIMQFGDKLYVNKTLESLNLSRNYLQDEGGTIFASQLFKGVTVKKINLSKNALAKETAMALMETFERKNMITHLDVSWNNFCNHVPSFIKMLDKLAEDNKRLVELNISWNSLEGIRIGNCVMVMMSEVPSLSVLNLSNNRLQGEAIQAIGLGLSKSKKLLTLDLSHNPLSPEDALLILEKMLVRKVKVENLLMGGIWVKKRFLEVLEKVQAMKCRKNFKIEFDGVLSNYTIVGPDPREVVLKRADFVGNASKRNKTDFGLYFLGLNKEISRIGGKEFLDRVKADNVPLDVDLAMEIVNVFQVPAPKGTKNLYLDVSLLCDFIHQLWPDRKLPPTPPPEPELPELPPPPPPPTKGGKKKK